MPLDPFRQSGEKARRRHRRYAMSPAEHHRRPGSLQQAPRRRERHLQRLTKNQDSSDYRAGEASNLTTDGHEQQGHPQCHPKSRKGSTTSTTATPRPHIAVGGHGDVTTTGPEDPELTRLSRRRRLADQPQQPKARPIRRSTSSKSHLLPGRSHRHVGEGMEQWQSYSPRRRLHLHNAIG